MTDKELQGFVEKESAVAHRYLVGLGEGEVFICSDVNIKEDGFLYMTDAAYLSDAGQNRVPLLENLGVNVGDVAFIAGSATQIHTLMPDDGPDDVEMGEPVN